MNSKMWNLLRAFIFLAGTYLSYRFIAERWIVGPVFGAVAVFWHWSFTRENCVAKYLVFMAASTLIYPVVLTLSGVEGPGSFLPEYLDLGVMTGTVLLPLTAHYLFKVSLKRTAVGIPVIYLVTLTAGIILSKFSLPPFFQGVIHSAAAWQIVFLFLFMRPTKR